MLTRLLLAFGVLLASVSGASVPAAAQDAARQVATSETRETYHPLPPSRLLDTRAGNGAPKAPLRGGSSIALQVTGRGGVPAFDVSAVVLNVTATAATSGAYVTVWPTGEVRPLASTLNVRPRVTVPNLVKVKVGSGGRVSLFASSGSMHLIADVAGWFGPDASSGGLYTPLAPARVLDTRGGLGQPAPGPVEAGVPITLPVAGRGGVPATGASAVVLNVTATAPTASAYVTVWPDGARPLASNLNVAVGQTVPNRVVVKLGADGAVRLFVSAGTMHLIADVGGWYGETPDGEIGASFQPVSPVRIVDTRTGNGAPKAPLAGSAALTVDVAGRAGVPAATALTPATAVVANITVTNPTASAYVTAWPNGADRPTTSDLNVAKGVTVANLAVVKLGPDGRIGIFASSGRLDVIVDVLGWYAGDVVLKPETTVLTGAQTAALTAPTGPESTTLTFSTPQPGIDTGDVLVSGITPNTPYGLLKKVTSVSGGTVGVEQAALTDVLAEGRLSTSSPLDSTTTAPSPLPGATTARRAGGIGLENAVSLAISKKVPEEGPASVTVEGSASLAAKATLEVEIDCCFDLSAKAELELSSSIELSVTGTVEAQVEKTFPLFRGRFLPFTVPVGPVPVVIMPAMDVDLELSGSVSYGMSGKITRSGGVKTGISYDEENGFDPYFDVEGEPGDFEGPTGETAAELKAALKPTGKVLVYGVVGPGFTPSVYAKLKVTACELTLGLGVALEAKFELEILGKDLGEFSATLSDEMAILAKTSTGVCGGLLVTPAEKTVVTGGTVPYEVKTDEGEEVTDPIVWTVDGGSITQAGVWTAPQTVGTYTVKATSLLDANVYGETTAEVVEPGPIWTGTLTFRWRYDAVREGGSSIETMEVTYTLEGDKKNPGNEYLYEEDVDWTGSGTWQEFDTWCGGLVESAAGSAASTDPDNHKEYVQIGTRGDGANTLYVGNAFMSLPGTNNNCRGKFGDPYEIEHGIYLGSHWAPDSPIGPPGATTASGSEHWVGEAPYQDGMQTWITWQLTREPDCDFDGLPDTGDPC